MIYILQSPCLWGPNGEVSEEVALSLIDEISSSLSVSGNFFNMGNTICKSDNFEDLKACAPELAITKEELDKIEEFLFAEYDEDDPHTTTGDDFYLININFEDKPLAEMLAEWYKSVQSNGPVNSCNVDLIREC